MKSAFVLVAATLVSSIACTTVQAQSIANLNAQQAQAEKQKQQLQKQIDQLQTQITKQESSKRDVVDDLRQSESEISKIGQKLDKLLDQEQEAKDELAALRQEESIQKDLLDSRTQELAEQLHAQFTSGLSPWSALLSGQDAQKIERDLIYLSYISKARSRTVKALNEEVDRLAKVRQKVQSRQKQISQLAKDTQSTKKDLEKEQQKYQATLKKIETDLKQRRQQAGRLQQDEERLNKIISGIESNIKAQREAMRQAGIARQKQAEERRRALASERQRQADLARAQAAAAKQQADRAAALRAQAQQAQQEALRQQRQAQERLATAQNEFGLAIAPGDQERAKASLQAALQGVERSKQDVRAVRQQSEDAEIERAKARLAQERAREAQRLLAKAQEDERLAQSQARQGGASGLSRGSPWPLRGSLMGRFGTTRPDTGDVWRGILISASAGAPVKAVAAGQVVFANWVRGFGNLIIVDHGNNYMTVYGYNQSLSKSVGDSVSVGQTIARAGSTGGQVEPALYFEVRNGSKPEDPLRWLAR